MPLKSETPHNGGASRNSCGGSFRDPLSPITFQVQFLIASRQLRPALAATVAALAFGGGNFHD